METEKGGGAMPSPNANIALPGRNGPILFASIHTDREIITETQQQKSKTTDGQANNRRETSQGKEKVGEKTTATSSRCKPIAAERPKIELPSQEINERMQYMKDHALIGKFIGFWPTEKALYGWIAAKWKSKGHITLQLGPKGFFTVIFLCLEDKFRIMDEGPYFFNSAGLYLRDWVARFNPDKEDLS